MTEHGPGAERAAHVREIVRCDQCDNGPLELSWEFCPWCAITIRDADREEIKRALAQNDRGERNG